MPLLPTHIRGESKSSLLALTATPGSLPLLKWTLSGCFSLALLVALALLSSPRIGSASLVPHSNWVKSPSSPLPRKPSASVLRGVYNATGPFDLRARLVPDQSYLTSSVTAGWTHQVMSITHILELALASGRVPLLPNFLPQPSTLGYADPATSPLSPIPPLAFSRVFDLPYLFAALSQPSPNGRPGLAGIIEWHELTDPVAGWDIEGDRAQDRFPVGCWTMSNLQTSRPNVAGLSRLGLAPDFIPLPVKIKNVRLSPSHLNIPLTASFLKPHSSAAASHIALYDLTDLLPPDDQLACIDDVFYANHRPKQRVYKEWSQAGSFKDPHWAIASHMRWEANLLARALDVLREVFEVAEGELVPSFVAVHIRHGDLLTSSCPFRDLNAPMDHEGRTGYSKESCLPLSAYSIAVEGALAQLARWRTVPASSSSYPIQNSSPTKHVLVSTDSTDPDLLASVQAKGWKIVTKELSDRIRAQEGDWMPTLIDTVLMSLGRSFVGTADSMMSHLTAHRVEEWNHAPPSLFVDWWSPTS